MLGIVVDIENMFMCVHKEEDQETKNVQLSFTHLVLPVVFIKLVFQILFYLFKMMRKACLQLQNPVIRGLWVSQFLEKVRLKKYLND